MERGLCGRACRCTSTLLQLGRECVSALMRSRGRPAEPGPAQELCLGSFSGSSPGLFSHEGDLRRGRRKTNKKPSPSQSIQTNGLQQCVFISFLKTLPNSHFTFQLLLTVRVMFLGVFPPVAATGTAVFHL